MPYLAKYKSHLMKVVALLHKAWRYRGDTTLHVATSRGFSKLCELIIRMKKESIYLVRLKNKEGETPLFQAALNWKKKVFAYISNLSGHTAPLQDLMQHNGDTILHCAISKEYFGIFLIPIFCSCYMKKMHVIHSSSKPIIGKLNAKHGLLKNIC